MSNSTVNIVFAALSALVNSGNSQNSVLCAEVKSFTLSSKMVKKLPKSKSQKSRLRVMDLLFRDANSAGRISIKAKKGEFVHAVVQGLSTEDARSSEASFGHVTVVFR
jgi:hypothetical protein